jgi:hypothetical protein
MRTSTSCSPRDSNPWIGPTTCVCWTLDQHIHANGFKPSAADPCIYIKWVEGRPTSILSVYVDDCLLITHTIDMASIKQVLAKKFAIKDLGQVTSILGIEVAYNPEEGVLQL